MVVAKLQTPFTRRELPPYVPNFGQGCMLPPCSIVNVFSQLEAISSAADAAEAGRTPRRPDDRPPDSKNPDISATRRATDLKISPQVRTSCLVVCDYFTNFSATLRRSLLRKGTTPAITIQHANIRGTERLSDQHENSYGPGYTFCAPAPFFSGRQTERKRL